MSRTKCDEDRVMEKFEDVYDRWESRQLSQAEAAEVLGKSERTFRRYIDRFEARGLAGLRDGRLGRVSEKALPADASERILALYRRAHMGWNVTHFHEHIVKHHGYTLGYTCLKNRLQEAGLVRVERRKGGHRRKRERKPCAGMMLHQDGSREVWLGGQPALDLVVTMDDATSEIYSAFLVDEEGTASTFRGLIETFAAKGLASSLYTDRGSHYFFTPEAGGKVDKTTKTQVGRALVALGVAHIAAYSPEARGRSERMFGTLQDRLIKELALAGIRTIETANAWIKATYLPSHNQRFTVPAALPESGFVAVSRERLAETLCIEEMRTVGRDNTIAWEGRRLQIPESPMRRHYVGAHVKVHAYGDGTLAVLYGPRVIARFTCDGAPLVEPSAERSPAQAKATGPSVASRSVPSRRGLAAIAPADSPARRPALTGPRRKAKEHASRQGKACLA
jgi:transposase